MCQVKEAIKNGKITPRNILAIVTLAGMLISFIYAVTFFYIKTENNCNKVAENSEEIKKNFNSINLLKQDLTTIKTNQTHFKETQEEMKKDIKVLLRQGRRSI